MRQLSNQILQCRPLLFDRTGQRELNKGSIEVVISTIRAEIVIALKVIREKPQTELKGDQTDAVGQIAEILWGEE